MATMREIKLKINSFEKTKQITKAMKMVAASYLRKAQEQAEASRPYAEKLKEVITGLAQGGSSVKHPMLQSRPVSKTGYLIVTSDRGLVGGYNSNLIRLLMQKLEERHSSKDEYVVFVIGRKGLEVLKKRNLPIIGQTTGVSAIPQFSEVINIAKDAVSNYADGNYDELYLLYNEFVNPVVQRPMEKRLLPLASDELVQEEKSQKTAYEYEPSEEEVLAELLPRYAETLIYNALLEGKASEHAAQMNAMENATDNATEIIGNLTLEFNRARQAAITQEIAEIVGGAAAL
ncbi:F0F1 ATP synthase subunit gamma [Shimazuella sp. AN120528]|uniref:ATP synthase F1 subunit gamma n=1 Tax=Shimazuella soli TaxID=1892854 RepID=UPI001F0E71EE|nr:ATP synthase F1 subunit gamma [Shimazuella soli]MCH5585233.1 F0F1 ATP synthase subunit gamma [Shimazuella soli]